MKALTFKRYGKSPEIGFAELPRPTLRPDELLVQVHAASVNPIDNMIPTGIFKAVLRFDLPATLGSDLAGVVTEVGSRVTRFKVGDAVFANIFDQGTGAIAELAVVPESAAALKPANLDFVQAARAFGVTRGRILLRHLLPNVMHLVLITVVIDFSGLVLAEAVLSYVGIGVDPSTISFGTMINMARAELAREPMVWWSLAAAFVFMFVLVLAANLFADVVRDAFDPRRA